MSKLTEKNQKRQLCDSHAEKILFKKKLGKIDSRNHNFSSSTKKFASENLTPMNESVAYNCVMLKCNGLIHGCLSRDGIIRIKRDERARPVKIYHMEKLHQLFPDFDFGDVDGDDDIFLYTS